MITKQYPFYLKSTIVLFGLVLLCYILTTLSEVMIPLAFGLLLAILLNPIAVKLENRKIPKVIAIILSMTLALIVVGSIGYFFVTQVSRFTDEVPILREKFTSMLSDVKQVAENNLGISIAKQNKFLADFQNSAKPFVGKTLGTMLGMIGMIFLIPVYVFLFMFYKPLILNFFFEAFDENKSKDIGVVMSQTKGAIQSYMWGLSLEALVVAILNVVALLLLGVKYALLIGVVGALLNILPYIGGIIAIALPVIIATITKDGYGTQIGVIVAYLAIQFVDNHFLVPYIVSSKVKINALVSVVVVLLGGALWGIPGMFLSIPFIGVIKIIFDRVPDLKPWGKLFGDEIPTRHGRFFRFVKKPEPLKES